MNSSVLEWLLFILKFFYRIILRLILSMFALLGLGSTYWLIKILIDESFSESSLEAEIEKSCGHLSGDAYGNCWEDLQLSSGGVGVLIIYLILFILMAIPAIFYFYRLIKSDISNLRNGRK